MMPWDILPPNHGTKPWGFSMGLPVVDFRGCAMVTMDVKFPRNSQNHGCVFFLEWIHVGF